MAARPDLPGFDEAVVAEGENGLGMALAERAGIGQSLIRLAVGLEHVQDIQADLLRGLGTLTS